MSATVEALMLRRAAEACKNAKQQMLGNVAWFDWVAPYLNRLADQAESAPSPSEGEK